MPKFLVVDIETMPDMDAVKFLPEVRASGVLKDPVKIEADIAEKKAAQLEAMALSPKTGKIACIGFYADDFQDVVFGEVDALNRFNQIVQDRVIITFNGKSFDLPYIFKRAMVNNLRWAGIPQMKAYTDKYKAQSKHIDLKEEHEVYGQVDKYESLESLSQVYLGYGKSDMDFKRIPELVLTEEGQKELSAYCLQDCKLTWELAKRFGFITPVECTYAR